MEIDKELEERRLRYGRLLENTDFLKTIEEVDGAFNLSGSVLPICNCPNASEYLFAREGMRTYRNYLMGLKTQIEQQINQNKEIEEDD